MEEVLKNKAQKTFRVHCVHYVYLYVAQWMKERHGIGVLDERM